MLSDMPEGCQHFPKFLEFRLENDTVRRRPTMQQDEEFRDGANDDVQAIPEHETNRLAKLTRSKVSSTEGSKG
jgi:hypothetical protein